MSAHVVLAVRGGGDAKSRCAPRLDSAGRDGLVKAMLGDMLDALARCPSVRAVHVVTPTAEIADFAAKAGASVILEQPPGGLNAAFAMARDRIAAHAPRAILALLPGDLPLLNPDELESLLRLARGPRRVVLAPAGDGGTGALVHRADIEFPLAFGVDSFQRHRSAAEALGLDTRVVQAPSLGLDVDRPEDLDRVLAAAPGGRTAALIHAQGARPEILV